MKIELCSITGCINPPQHTIAPDDRETIVLCDRHNVMVAEIVSALLPEED